jgi:hypothetical protein
VLTPTDIVRDSAVSLADTVSAKGRDLKGSEFHF